MIIVSQHYILPVVIQCNEMRAWPIQARLREFPWILNELVVPFIIEYMMVWYLIWECILNLLGELTRFADRGFYGSWWNSTTWDQFARDWNKPVHNFLLRHVYHSSISAWQVSKPVATLITFFLSSIVHELVMWCIFKKLRGYLLCMQMLQVPLVLLSRTRLLKNRQTLGNVLFWLGIYTGKSAIYFLWMPGTDDMSRPIFLVQLVFDHLTQIVFAIPSGRLSKSRTWLVDNCISGHIQ